MVGIVTLKMANKNRFYEQWWFWVIILIIIGLVFFTPLKSYIFPEKCSTWLVNVNEPPTGNNVINTCSDSHNVCVPKNKEEFCQGKILEDFGALCGGGSSLAYGHTTNNPAQGICRKSLGGVWMYG